MAEVRTLDDFEPVWDRLVVHLQRAGRRLSRPVTDVRIGEPGSVPAAMVVIWYDGEHEGELVPNTLTLASYTERLIIRWYWPVPERTPALTSKLERDVRRAARATTREINADRHLGGACSDVRFVERTYAGWVDMAPGWARTVTLTIGVEMVDQDDIETGD